MISISNETRLKMIREILYYINIFLYRRLFTTLLVLKLINFGDGTRIVTQFGSSVNIVTINTLLRYLLKGESYLIIFANTKTCLNIIKICLNTIFLNFKSRDTLITFYQGEFG